MPTYRITDPNSGKVFDVTGDSIPTENELTDIFSSQNNPVVPAEQPVDPQDNIGPFEAGAIAAGRSIFGLGRAVGLVDDEDPVVTEAFKRLEKKRPTSTAVGEVVGEAIPFLAPGTALGAIPKLGARVVAATGLGITEGGLIAKSRGSNVAEGAGIGGAISGGLEAAFPLIGRMGSALIRKLTGNPATGAVIDSTGKPTPELTEALNQLGITFEDFTQEAVNTLKQTNPGSDPAQAARLANLQSLGAPATKGDITQDFAQQAQEARLVESSNESLGDPLRALRLEQSRAFSDQISSRINDLGVSDDVGDTIKAALEGRKKLLLSEKNALYKQVAETAPEIKNAPIFTGTIADAMPSDKEIRRLSRINGNQAPAVEGLMIEFGINKNPEKVKSFLDSGGEIDQLNIGNFDEFRQALNQIEKSDMSRSTSVIIGPIKRALDEEAGLIDDAMEAIGLTDQSVLEPLKKARATVRQIKTEFSPEAISGRLIKSKRDGVTPLIESSKVFSELMGGQKAPELLERTISSLLKSTAGKKAIGDLQARTMVDLLDNAFKAGSRKIKGEKVFGATAYNARLKQIGDRRLKALFSTRPDILKKLKQVGKIANDITPPNSAVPKGSASVILDALNKLGIMTIMGKVPGGALLVESIRQIADKGADRQVLQKALDAKPNVKRITNWIADDLPGFASVLGISGFATEKEDKK